MDKRNQRKDNTHLSDSAHSSNSGLINNLTSQASTHQRDIPSDSSNSNNHLLNQLSSQASVTVPAKPDDRSMQYLDSESIAQKRLSQ